jgi:hypothetical protein
MPGDPTTICEDSVSAAWARALITLYDTPKSRVSPMLLSIVGGTSALPDEDDLLQCEIDRFLDQRTKPSTSQSALTIFPYAIWQRRGCPGVTEFSYFCVKRLYPRMKARSSLNRYGTYFQRMMAYSTCGTPKNQLEHIIKLMNRSSRSRESALQISVLHPALDHTGQAVRGFPCLQQVGISYESHDAFALNALYPTQYVVDRGYGNYLGLCHLGLFIAHQTGLAFHRLNCYVTSPMLGNVTKAELKGLVTQANEAVDSGRGQ